MEWRFYTSNIEHNRDAWVDLILKEIKDKNCKRKRVAHIYRIIFNKFSDVNWKKINQAIIKRWSKSGLIYIKNLSH